MIRTLATTFHSLHRKLLIPLLSVVWILACVVLTGIYFTSKQQLGNTINQRAARVAATIDGAIQFLPHAADLQPFIESLANDPTIDAITIFGSSPRGRLVALASSDPALVGKLVADAVDADSARNVSLANLANTTQTWTPSAPGRFDLAKPLPMASDDTKQLEARPAVAWIQLDISRLEKDFDTYVLKIGLAIAVAVVIFSAILYSMMYRIILRPIRHLEELVAAQTIGHVNPVDKYEARDEIGKLAHWLRTAWAEATSAIAALESQKESLRESEERYRLIAAYSNDIIWKFSVDGVFSFVSPASSTVLGYEPSTMIGRNLFDWVHPNDVDSVRLSIEQSAFKARLDTLTFQMLGAEGHYIWLETSLRGLRESASARADHFVGVSRDITERKVAESALRDQAEHTRAILDHVIDGIITIDQSGKIDAINPAVTGIFGYAPAELIGQNVRVLMPNPYRDSHDNYLKNYQTTGEAKVIGIGREVEGRRKDGTLFPMDLGVSEITRGGKRMYVGIIRDISERKYAEQVKAEAETALRDQAEHTRAILDNMIDGIITIAHNGNIDAVNPAVTGIFGYVPDELIGQNVRMLMPNPYRDSHNEYLRNYQTTGIAKVIGIGREVEGRRKDGSVFPMELGVSEITRQGERMYVGIVRDISERKRVERLKSEFISAVSHEIRTPMNAILGFTQLLTFDDNMTEQQRQNLAKVRKAGDHLLNIINDVLDLSRVEAGKVTLTMQPVSVSAVLRECRSLTQAQADVRDIRLNFETDENQQLWVVADRTRLRQVLLNLISNAVKYNRIGGDVWVSCEKMPDENVRITVRDNGPGIAPGKQADLFQPFNRLGAERSDIEGTGIGLTITRHLVELMDGSIGFRSQPGEGSEFWVQFHWSQAAQPAVSSESDAPSPESLATHSAHFSVLYVEDNPINLEFVRALCAQFWPNMQLIGASSAEAGLELAMLHPPDLFLMDINLPGMDGFEALATLKANRQLRNIPVVAITANAMKENIERARSAGFSDYITKPIDIPRFLSAVDRLLSKSYRPAGIATGKVRRVLVAEDNQVNQEVAVALLSHLGFDADTVKDGASAVAAVERTHYAVVLMDCEMPVMDGFSATRKIREMEGNARHTPIIALTAHALTDTPEKWKSAGMDDCINKPLREEDLRERLEGWIPTALYEDNKSVMDTNAPALQPRTVDQLKRVLGAGASSIIEAMLKDIPIRLETIRRAIESRDKTVIRGEAHTLAGSCSNLGAARFAAMCVRLNDYCKSGQMELLPDALEALVEEFRLRLEPALNEFRNDVELLRHKQTA